MVDRYSISSSAKEIADHYTVDVPSYYKPSYNAGPTQLLPVITHHNPIGLSFFYWGAIPEWVKKNNVSEKLINTRSETIAEKSAYKKRLMRYRCAVPTNGFFGWKKIGKKSAIPYFFFLKDKGLMLMAALWEEFEDEQENTHHTFSVITTPSTKLVQSVTDRMPLLLDSPSGKIWLDKQTTENDLLSLLAVPNKFLLESYTVSPRIATLDVNDATLILPSAPADQHGNLTLFD